MRFRAAALVLFLSVRVGAASRLQESLACLRYEPDTVSITGRLARHTFYGAPGYGDDPSVDEREIGFYLDLSSPICASGGSIEADFGARHDVRQVQLVLDEAGYAALRPYLDRRVTLRGVLFADHTGHHHAPLLLTVLTPVRVQGRR